MKKPILNIKSLKEQVYDYLREEFRMHKLKPGAIINMDITSKELGISKTPLREALLQLEMDRPSKCGTETERENTPRSYGGYWYDNSLQEGIECHKVVRAAVDRDKVYEKELLGCPISVRFNNGYDEPVTVILKRACTEFEQHCGPSDQWDWDDDQVETERIAFDSFAQDITHARQTDIQLSLVFKDWIHRAYRIGDEKYKLFTNGNALFDPVVTYHDMPKKKMKEFMERTKVCPR